MTDDPKDPLVTGDDVGSAKENPNPINPPTEGDKEAAKDGLPVDPTMDETKAAE